MTRVTAALRGVRLSYYLLAFAGVLIAYAVQRVSHWGLWSDFGWFAYAVSPNEVRLSIPSLVSWGSEISALCVAGWLVAPVLALWRPRTAIIISLLPITLTALVGAYLHVQTSWPLTLFVSLIAIAAVSTRLSAWLGLMTALLAAVPIATEELGLTSLVVAPQTVIQQRGAWSSIHGGAYAAELTAIYFVVALAAWGFGLLLRRHAGRTGAPGVEAPAVAPGMSALVLDLNQLGLTPREVEVFHQLARGRTNTEVATDLGVGVETVKSHVAEVLRKLGLRDRTAVVVYAHEHGLVPRN